MRTALLSILTVLAICTLTPIARAQSYDPPQSPPVTMGAFAELGLEWGPGDGFGTRAGLFSEFTRRSFRPGVELRGIAELGNVSGTLAGPRLSHSGRRCTLFAVGLFGPAHLEHYQASTGNTTDLHGLYSGAAIGFDLMSARLPQVGLHEEVSVGTFSGLAQSAQVSASLGIVLRIPH